MKYSRLHKSIAIACLGIFGAQAAWPQAFNLFQPATGVLVGSATTYVTTAAASTDIVSLWTGTCNATSFLRGDGSCQATGTVTSITAGTGLTGGTITTSGTVALSTPVTVANGGTGAATLTGVLKGNGASAFTAAVRADMLLPFEPSGDLTNSLGIGQSGLPLGGGNTGVNNIGVGFQSLASITGGNNNTAMGRNALSGVTGGSQNVSVGNSSSASISGGNNDTAVGYNALNSATGSDNTAIGQSAGSAITSGASNIILGESGNITTGSNNILIGNSLAGTTAASSNQVDIADLLRLNSTSTAVPVISACGTSPSVDAKANNYSGTVTVGTVAAASCTITFASAYASFVHCRVSSQSSIATFAYSYTTAAITVTATSLVADKIDYQCDGL